MHLKHLHHMLFVQPTGIHRHHQLLCRAASVHHPPADAAPAANLLLTVHHIWINVPVWSGWFKELLENKQKTTKKCNCKRNTNRSPPFPAADTSPRPPLPSRYGNVWSNLQKEQMKPDPIWNAVISPSTRLSAADGLHTSAWLSSIGWCGVTFKRRF